MRYSYKYFSNPGINKEQNEDTVEIYELNEGLLIAVCDGIGGSTNSHIASKLCAETIKEYFLQSEEPNIIVRIKSSIDAANDIIKNHSDNSENTRIATTADVLFFNTNFAYWGHIGDSRIYHFKNNSLHRMTKDHSVVQKLLDEGFLTMSEADLHPTRNMIYNALGESKKIKIDLSKLYLNANDLHYFIICTDGVSSVLSDEELKGFLELADPAIITKSIEQRLDELNPEDDYSLVIVKLERE